jgi:membrane-associated phospholipid phosphatase
MRLDEQLSKKFAAYIDRNAWVAKLADFCAVQTLWFMLGAYALLSLNLKRWPLEILLAWAVTLCLEYAIHRPRPFQKDGQVAGVEMLWVPPSFPSAHATIAFSVVTALSAMRPDLFALALVLAVLVSLGRVAVRVHYFGDVLAGAAVGFLVTSLLL